MRDVQDAVGRVDGVTTDLWASMGLQAENRLHTQKALLEDLLGE